MTMITKTNNNNNNDDNVNDNNNNNDNNENNTLDKETCIPWRTPLPKQAIITTIWLFIVCCWLQSQSQQQWS